MTPNHQPSHPNHPELRGIHTGSLTVRRKGTLVRPDRYVNPPPILRSATIRGVRAFDDGEMFIPPRRPFSLWGFFAKLCTCFIPPYLLSLCGVKGSSPQQAWREKVTLCLISLSLCALVFFFIIGMNPILCPQDEARLPPNAANSVSIKGKFYDIRTSNDRFRQKTAGVNFRGEALHDLFRIPNPSICNGLDQSIFRIINVKNKCETLSPEDGGGNCLDYPDDLPHLMDRWDDAKKVSSDVFYNWNQIEDRGYKVFNGAVLNLENLYAAIERLPESVVRNSSVLRLVETTKNKTDITRPILSLQEFSSSDKARKCFLLKFYAGKLNTLSSKCVFSSVFSIIVSIIVLASLLSRVIMAILFDWFLSRVLSRPPEKNKKAEKHKTGGSYVWPYNAKSNKGFQRMGENPVLYTERTSTDSGIVTGGGSNDSSHVIHANYLNALKNTSRTVTDNDLYTVMFVACYSENEASLRTTMESLTETKYNDKRKLLFVVADGLITGKGNPQSTPDTLVNMIQLDSEFGSSPRPYSYISIAVGSRQHNMARVYAGHFLSKNHRVPIVLVVKCGTPEDANDPKPGNRGKRDSQIIIMNFFSRVLLNDRMTPLDFDLFRKITHLMGVTPDIFEIVVMVDADTKVHPMCMRYMVNAMINDNQIMGLCGETRIENKTASWVTAIQVFEYYVSHNLGKAFESVFGGVTCLPGCFCVYRIKAKKGNEWIPILANPDIIETYSANEVETLHQKNLLLLGEDRFLTTFMIRTFTSRKMVFIPSATCKTVVPDDFKTLLSQRRRWINSTVHNLMELVLVNNLCGTFCFSMQFIVLLDLISTAVLPASIISTLYFFIKVILRKEFRTIGEIVNITILLLVIFFPIIVVLLSGRRWSNIFWMLIYIIALPIWNFVLPVYAFWHFDDFSWGATRQVSGGGKETDGHAAGSGDFDASKVSLRRWAEYERAWRKNLEKRRIMRAGSQSSPNNSFRGHRTEDFIPSVNTRWQPYDYSPPTNTKNNNP